MENVLKNIRQVEIETVSDVVGDLSVASSELKNQALNVRRFNPPGAMVRDITGSVMDYLWARIGC